MFSVLVVSCLVFLPCLYGQQLLEDITSECPGDGFFADARQCDKYYACRDGVMTEKLCVDGFVFNDLNPALEKCDFPFQISCEGRPDRQPAQISDNCPRAYGYFPDADLTFCSRFYYCAAGIGSELNCPETLVFSLESGTCTFPHQANREDCAAENLLNFTCPKVPTRTGLGHPRYPDPDDCQSFYVCVNGKTPQKGGCPLGEVFNNQIKACTSVLDVPECADYYIEYFDNYFAKIKAEGRHAQKNILAAAVISGYPIPLDLPKRVKISPKASSKTGGAARRRKPIAQSAPQQSDAPSFNFAAQEPDISVPAPAVAEPPRRAPTSAIRTRPSLSSRRRPAQVETKTTEPPIYDDYYYYDDPAELQVDPNPTTN